MNLVLDTNNFSLKNIFFGDSIKNTVMNDSSFIRIIYSNKNFILNGIYIKIDFEKETNQIKFLENSNNIKTINLIEKIENYILNTYNNSKNHCYKIKDQINFIIYKSLAYNQTNQNKLNYILKISGIWETTTQIGITYKFIDINHL